MIKLMNDSPVAFKPEVYDLLLAKSEEIGFGMPSDLYIGSFLKTLVSSKPQGRFLELGTGIGLSLSWILQGMDEAASCISLDNDPALIRIVRDFLGNDKRLQLICEDGSTWINEYSGPPFDLIFADTWPGKYSLLDETLALLKPGGFYIIDDMEKQPNWPDGHEQKAAELIQVLERREDLILTKMGWSTGLIIAVKRFNPSFN